MRKIGLTGGMGCGKSTIAHIFSSLGIPVYDADREAKRLSRLPSTQQAIATQFGEQAARDKKILADIVFKDPTALARLNAIVHPLVMEDCRSWFEQLSDDATGGKPPYAIAEAAILFESGMDRLFDHIITVEASPEEQIERVMQRDRCTRQEVLDRLSRQLSSEDRRQKADFAILNGNNNRVLNSVLELDKKFRAR